MRENEFGVIMNLLDAEPMSNDMIEDISDRNQYHLSINRREARYNICDCFIQRQAEWGGAIIST